MYTTPPIYDAPPIYGWIDQYLSHPNAVDLCDIASDKETWKAISKHLLSHKGLQSKNYSSYPEFLNAVPNRDVFPFPTDNSTVYHSFKDAVTEKIVSSWKPQEKVFLSADSTKETLDTLIQYFSAYDPNQRIVIFSGRKYRTPSEITGSDSLDKFLNSESNIMVIPYDVAAAKCRNRDQAFFFFCGQSRYLFFLDAACILNDSWDDNLNYFAYLFLKDYFQNPFPNPSKIFLSNSMEEFYDFFQQINLSSKEFSPNPNTLLALPMDYTFLEPVLYENLTAICPEIQKKSAYEKWLVFVLEQVLTNAVKYTRKGKISIYLDQEKEKTLVVEDTGMGIRPEDLPRIFEWGYTGYNGRIKNRATGIGLALCRQTMEMLGHRISAKSEPGKGTCIYLDLAVDPVRDY